MNLVRKYKISKITNVPLEGKELELFIFLDEWFSDLFIVDDLISKFPFDTIYSKSRSVNIVLDYNIKDDENVVWVKNFNLWKILESKFSLNDKGIKTLLEFFIKRNIPFFRDKDFIIKKEVLVFINFVQALTEMYAASREI